mgnify:CR=1 FL=1
MLAILLVTLQVLSSAGLNLDTLARRVGVHTSWCSPEKLYVHLDRTCYAATETIWFKGYLNDAFPKSKQQGSNFIYVELLDSSGNAVLRHKIKRTQEGFPGYMFLPEDIKSGDYVFRAYSRWQMNKSPEYMFNQKLVIVGARPIKPGNVVEQSSVIDISFYPEGGRYFCGKTAVMGFKVMDGNGKSVDFTGMLCDDKGEVLMTVETQFDGMGSFSFVPGQGRGYYLCSGQGRKYPLPEPSAQGAAICMKDSCDILTARIEGYYNGACTLFSVNRSEFVMLSKVVLDGTSYSFILPESVKKPGINHLMLLDQYGHILSERKYFVYDRNKARCTLDSVSISHVRCKPVTAVLGLRDFQGHPVSGECSVSVLRSAFNRYHQQDGIESFLSLSSELKGHINDPYHYFDQAVPLSSRVRDMDLLMLIQGWNYYDIEEITSSSRPFVLEQMREYSQKLSGRILNGKRNKMPKNFSFVLVIPSLHITRMLDIGQADSYTIDEIPFPENTRFLISINRKGIGREYVPRWSGDVVAAPYKYAVSPGRRTDIADDFLPVMYEGVVTDTLAAAVVTAGPDSDPFAAGVNGREISLDELKHFQYYTLVQYVLYRTPRFEYNGDYMYNRNLRRPPSRQVNNSDNPMDESERIVAEMEEEFSDKGKVKLLDNGMETDWWAYETLEVKDLSYLNISTESDPAYNADGGLVAIKVRPGVQVDQNANESVLCFVPLGYQQPSAFYSPRYDRGDSHEIYDHRNTIYWSPDVKVTDGRATIEFCDTDQQDYPYYVRVEGLAEDGTPFSGRAVIK